MSDFASEYTRNFQLGDLGENDPRAGMPTQGGRLLVQFYTREQKDEVRSAALGRAAYREVEMIRVIIPGDKNNILERRVRPADKVKHAKQYDAFRKMQDQDVPDGHTRLEYWPVLSRSQIADLKSLNIFTVEALADLSDDALSRIGIGARQLRSHAKAFLETAKTGAVPARIIAENEELKNKVGLLSGQIEDLLRKFEAAAKKSGIKVEDIATPQIAATVATKPSVMRIEIPEDYQSLSLADLRELVGKFSPAPVRNKSDAYDLIEEYLGKVAA